MEQLEQTAYFSGSSIFGTCQITYTAGGGVISVKGLAFKGPNRVSAWYGFPQNFTMYCGSQSASVSVAKVDIRKDTYIDAGFSGATFYNAWGNQTVSFTVRGKNSPPNTLSYSFTINGGMGSPSVSISNVSVGTTTISASCTGSAGS